jgi:hypothetical protein
MVMLVWPLDLVQRDDDNHDPKKKEHFLNNYLFRRIQPN